MMIYYSQTTGGSLRSERSRLQHHLRTDKAQRLGNRGLTGEPKVGQNGRKDRCLDGAGEAILWT